MGADVPFLIPSLAKEGLVSLSERVSSRVGGDYNTGQLVQPGKSNIEEKQFLRSQGDEGSNFVSEVGLLDELTESNDAPSVPLLSDSDNSFSPSAFMNMDTRGGGSTFGGVR